MKNDLTMYRIMVRSHQAKAKAMSLSLSLLLEWLHNSFKLNRFRFHLV